MDYYQDESIRWMMIKDRGKTNICCYAWYIPLLTKSPGCSRGRNPCGIRGYFPFVRILHFPTQYHLSQPSKTISSRSTFQHYKSLRQPNVDFINVLIKFFFEIFVKLDCFYFSAFDFEMKLNKILKNILFSLS